MPADEDWQHEMERYLQHFARSGKRPSIVFTPHARTNPVWSPAMDIYETSQALVVVLDLAGVNPNEVEVRAEPGRLLVRGRRIRRAASPTEDRMYHALEIPYGLFERAIALPNGLETDATEAAYRDGLLEITLPKRSPKQVRIAIHGQEVDE